MCAYWLRAPGQVIGNICVIASSEELRAHKRRSSLPNQSSHPLLPISCFSCLPESCFPALPLHPSLRPGSLTLTGQVGEVLEESARIALSWIRSNAYELGLEPSPRAVHAVHNVLPAGILPTAVHDLRLGAQPLHVLRGASVPNMMQRDGAYRPNPEAATATPTGEPASASSCLGRAGGAAVIDISAPAEELRARSSAARGHDGAVCSLRGAPEAGAASGSSTSAGNPATSWDIHIHLPAGALCAASVSRHAT